MPLYPLGVPQYPDFEEPSLVNVMSATPPVVPAEKKKWTILQYSAADNNLKSFMVDDIDEMEKVGSDANTNLVVQVDTGRQMRRILLQPDANKGIASPSIEETGAVDMGDPRTLAEFVEWGVKNFPAEHYMLVISDHGDNYKGACEDVSASSWMSLREIHQGLADAEAKTGVKLDILGFDACNMAGAEVAYELKDRANYLIASEKTEGGAGWTYDQWLGGGQRNSWMSKSGAGDIQASLSRRVDCTPEQLARSLVAGTANYNDTIMTLSATDLGKMDQVKESLEEFSKAILATDTSVWKLKMVTWGTQSFEGHKDAYHFAERIAKHDGIEDQRLKAAATGLMSSIDAAVIEEQHHPSQANAHGLTLEIPAFWAPGREYKELDLPKETHWDEAQKQLTRLWTTPRPVD